ncbi:TonB-dependent receptor [Sphingomonas populi]|uniref:TonB-dependent receptor n=1 Tax=Sphingomonas populi TaxID=2484750 RepID=A0A4Q6XXE2_9SPHN|nr:TonB-dependent receptor [Sphingomonas populi]RZF65443.1 TonB-dependent receptor [Sphingomonas populi]
MRTDRRFCAGVAMTTLAVLLASAAQGQSATQMSGGVSPPPGPSEPGPSQQSVATGGNAQPSADTVSEAAQDIIVSGIRAAQRQSIDIKRNAVNSVDAIASEDLGKMPDQNVAESLQRVPGITIDRNRGVGNGVTVRGLGPQFNTVTINGRVIATDSAGREFNFDILPSELIAGANVFKSPQANLNGASIGATVDIHTLRPLEGKTGFRGGGSLRANIDDLGDKRTPSGAAYVTWKDESGRLGVSFVASYDERNERTDNFSVGASSYPRSFDDGYYGDVGGGGKRLCLGTANTSALAPRIDVSKVTTFCNVDMYHNLANQVEFSNRKRLGLDGTVQFKPTDTLLLTFDGLYSHDDEHYHSSALTPDFSGGTLVKQVVSGGTDTTAIVGGQTRTVHVGGTATSETFHDGTVDEIVENRPTKSTTYLFGFNAKWNQGPFSLALDLDTSKAQFRNAGALFTTIRLKHMDYTYDRNTGSPLASFTLSNPNYADAATDVNHRLAHYVAAEGQNFDDTIYEGHLDGSYDGGAIVAYGGVGYSERTKVTTGFSEPNACAYCGSDVPLPSTLFTPTTFNFFGGRAGGNTANWVDYDADKLFQTMLGLNGTADPSLHTGSLSPLVVDPAASSQVKEKVALGYLMFEYKGALGDLPLAINTGVRVEDTNFSSSGAGQTVLSAKSNGTGQNIIILSGLTPLSSTGHYTDILPSVNVRLNITPTLIFRTAASRVISRPTLTDLSSAQSISSNPGNERITRGNPNLQPFRASQAEAGLEWYYNPDSLLSATFFYKSIDSFITRGTTTQQVDDVKFIVDQPVNGTGATVKGVELSYRTLFKFLPGVLSGLGTQLSYTYTDSNAHYTNPTKASTSYSLVGLSKNSYTAVAFYEKGPIQLRASYTFRDGYLFTPQTQTGIPEFVDSYDQLDAGVQISLTKNVILTADATNLTNSNEFHYANVIANTQEYRSVGRRYTAGVRVRF